MMRSPRAGLAVFGGLVLPVTFETLGMRKHFNMNNALDTNAPKIPGYKYSDFFQTELSIVPAGCDWYSPNQRKRHELPRSAPRAAAVAKGQICHDIGRQEVFLHQARRPKLWGKSGGFGVMEFQQWFMEFHHLSWVFMGFILWKGRSNYKKNSVLDAKDGDPTSEDGAHQEPDGIQ